MSRNCTKNEEGFCIIFDNAALNTKMMGSVGAGWHFRDTAIKTYGEKQLDTLRAKLGL